MRHHYTHAPITEAVIDFRVDGSSAIVVSTLEKMAAALGQQFPTSDPINTISMGFVSKPGDKTRFQSGQEEVGKRLMSTAKDRILQIQKAGFSYSHMPPYSDWNTFRDEARPLWEKYLSYTSAGTVTRCAVRVINKLPLPCSFAGLSKFTSLNVSAPSDLDLSPLAFFTQVQTAADAYIEGCRVTINSGAAPLPDNMTELLLDFDIYCEGHWESASPKLWSLLDKFSEIKDLIFESYITDHTRELIK